MTGPHDLRWGLAASLVALLVLLGFAFLHDPFGTQRTLTTRFDNVENIASGVPVTFAGLPVGEVSGVRLEPASRTFAVALSVRRDWQPSRCAFARIDASNPLATPRIELVAPPGSDCGAVRTAASCAVLDPGGRATLAGCRRGSGLFETASLAIGQAAAVATTANAMAGRLSAMMGSSGSSGLDMARVARDSSAALASLAAISHSLDASLAPGRGDIALTLANVRRASGRAGDFDMATLNGTLHDVRTMVATNQDNIAGILADGRATTAQTHALLEGMASSLDTTSANLARASDSMAALGERLAADPTYVLHGRRYADPPPPSGGPR